MFKNILSDKQKKELENIFENYNFDNNHAFWTQFETWIFEFLKNYLSTVFRNSMSNSLKEMHDSVKNLELENKKIEIIIH